MYIPEIPNNSLKKEIEELAELAIALQEKRRFKFNMPATDTEIAEWEKNSKITLPTSYADWLMFSNGSILRGNVAEIYGLDRIEYDIEYLPDDYVVIGSLTGDGEIICFSKERGTIFTDEHGDITLYDDFRELIEIIIDDIKGMW